MSGTPFETLLEPISQPALEHEIVVGLIQAERTCGAITGISERGIFRNRISRGAYRFAYHEIDRLIARLVCIVHARSKAALQEALSE